MGAVASALIGVFAVLFGLIANILGTITGAFLGAAVNLFNWVISENFISLSYTKLDNPFIALGWGLTKDLTNIIFVLALVAIGLGTALRLTGYQAQKALPILIIIALLINFTPVICGFIVDASNIVMKFFISGGFAGGNNFVNYAFRQWESIGPLAGGVKFWDPIASHEATAAAVGSIVLVGFNFIAALIYLLFAFLFVLRYIAIWTLVILSPFAFACYILPATRGVWSQWWKQFIQWSIIGVIAAFFLYLGDSLLNEATKTDFIRGAMGEISGLPGLAPILNSVLPYGISLAFLFIGLMMALSTSAMGANFITTGIKTGTQKVGKWTAKKGWERGAPWLREKIPATLRKWGEKETMKPTWGTGLKGAKGWMMRTAAAPLYATRRGLGALVGPAMVRAEKTKIAQVEEDISKRKLSTPEILKMYQGATDDATRIASINSLIKQQKIDEAMDPTIIAKKYGISPTAASGLVLSNTEIEKKLKVAESWDAEDTIKAGFLNLPRVKASLPSGGYNAKRGRPETTGEIMGREILSKMKKAEDWKSITKGVLTDPDSIEAILKTASGSQLSQVLETHQQDAIEAIQKNIPVLAAKDKMSVKDFIRQQTKLGKYFTTGAGANNYGIVF